MTVVEYHKFVWLFSTWQLIDWSDAGYDNATVWLHWLHWLADWLIFVSLHWMMFVWLIDKMGWAEVDCVNAFSNTMLINNANILYNQCHNNTSNTCPNQLFSLFQMQWSTDCLFYWSFDWCHRVIDVKMMKEWRFQAANRTIKTDSKK